MMKYPVFIFAVICALGADRMSENNQRYTIVFVPRTDRDILAVLSRRKVRDIKYEIGAVEYDPTDFSTITADRVVLQSQSH